MVNLGRISPLFISVLAALGEVPVPPRPSLPGPRAVWRRPTEQPGWGPPSHLPGPSSAAAVAQTRAQDPVLQGTLLVLSLAASGTSLRPRDTAWPADVPGCSTLGGSPQPWVTSNSNVNETSFCFFSFPFSLPALPHFHFLGSPSKG